jgi:alanine-glyoxylate transaminase / serine-glyoxylate transaminase / serine-pyruvate transaminase
MGSKSGRHFLQIPGPTNVPDRILRTLSRPTIDHRGPALELIAREAIEGLQRVFETKGAVVIYLRREPARGKRRW